MSITIARTGDARLLDASVDIIAGISSSVATATTSLRDRLRGQVVSAGLGVALSKTWQSKLNPATATVISGYVWTKSPLIMQGFEEGATIIPRNGSRWLAIPTANVPPRAKGSNAPGDHIRKQMTPVEVEANFNRDLRLIAQPGQRVAYLVMDELVSASSGHGFRRNTSRRLAQGRVVKSILMFVLVPQVTLTKRLDIAGAIAAMESEFSAKIETLMKGP